MYETLQFDVVDSIGWVRLNRPRRLNAISPQMVSDLRAVVDRVRADSSIRVLVFVGTGRAFSAGADIAELVGLESSVRFLRFLDSIHAVLDDIESLDRPTIAAVNGLAYGGGCELAIACDLRLMAESAKLGVPEILIGVLPGGGGTQRLPRLLPPAIAKQMIFFGEPISAETAARHGIANAVVPDEQIEKTARRMGEEARRAAAARARRGQDAGARGRQRRLAERPRRRAPGRGVPLRNRGRPRRAQGVPREAAGEVSRQLSGPWSMFFETTLAAEAIDRHTASGAYPDRLLNDFVDEWAKESPLKTAIVDARSRYGYQELRARADTAALGFLDCGIRRGDVVTVQLPNWNEFIIIALALERIGAVINPVAPIFRQRELKSILRLAQSRAVVMPASFRGFDYPAMYAELGGDFPALATRVVIGEGVPRGFLDWHELLDRGADREALRAELDLFRPDPNDVIELMFTSGTTGEPKGVMHTANTISAGADPIRRMLGVSPSDVFHMASTLGHQTGFLYGMQATLRSGARLVLQETWDPVHFVKLVDAERITCSMGATPFLADMLGAPNLADHDTSSLRIFICGGAPIPRPLAETAVERLSCRLVPVWGMTEMGIVTLVSPHHPAAKIADERRHPLPRRRGRRSRATTARRRRLASRASSGRARPRCSPATARDAPSPRASSIPRGGSAPETAQPPTPTASFASPAAARTSSSAAARTCR